MCLVVFNARAGSKLFPYPAHSSLLPSSSLQRRSVVSDGRRREQAEKTLLRLF